ncbi:unnamed protein product [Symbiodinium microadriaticum]|nr:unnamed protein product [Symbiodinium microadriaticum]
MTHDIFMTWLTSPHYGLGRSFTEYKVPGWAVLSSPDPHHRCAGVAMYISERVARKVPPDVWKRCAAMVLPHVQALFRMYLSAGELRLPADWRDGWLHLLPKPRKPTKIPANLRPIALQCPLGKCLARIIKNRVLQIILPKMEHTPHFAYLPGRSTYNAISRIAQHRRAASSQLAGLRREVHERRAGKTCVQAEGAALLSIDMSNAFDQVSHAYLAASMRHLGVDEDTIHLTPALHQSSYHITHDQHEECIALQSGIRQGCVLSPLLWVCVTTYMLHCLAERTSPEWVRYEVTAFVDDFISAFTLHRVEDAQTMAQRIQQRSTLYYDMGTPFNPLPLAYAPTIDYLGVVMSYGAFERHSMEKRLHAAKANQAQLAKFLYGRKGLTQTHRISVCRTCVRSAATYGLPAVSLTHKSLKALHAFELKTLRAIARSPRHITHETSQATVQRIFELISMEGLLMKFHATRPMAPTYRSEVLPFVLMVSNRRGLADELHNLFSLLCNNACLSIVRVRMRPDRMKRQPLAVRLGQCAENLLDVAKRAAKLPGTWARAAQAFFGTFGRALRWGHQHYTHALATETPLFTIQIKRYGFREGQSYKISTPIALRPNAVVDVPIFCTGAGTETYSAQYRLVFAVVHTGSTPNAGHYQTALSSGSRFLLSDDRIAPKRRPAPPAAASFAANNHSDDGIGFYSTHTIDSGNLSGDGLAGDHIDLTGDLPMAAGTGASDPAGSDPGARNSRSPLSLETLE